MLSVYWMTLLKRFFSFLLLES